MEIIRNTTETNMKRAFIKLTEEIKTELLESKEIQSVIKSIKEASDEETGRFRVVIATDDRDRMGEIINIAGMDLKHYKNNPTVLFGHDYKALPIAITDKITKQTVGKQKRIVPREDLHRHQQTRKHTRSANFMI